MKQSQTVSMDDLIPLIRECLAEGQSVRVFPKGTSMLPMLRQGVDSVVLSPLPETIQKYDLPLYRREDGKYILHRIIRAGDTCVCMGDNQFTSESGVKREHMIALVTGFYRGEKFHSVKETAYQLYCRLWHYSRPIRRICRGGIGCFRRILK